MSRQENKKPGRHSWPQAAFYYVVFLLVALGIIEIRITAAHPHIGWAERIPLLTAAFTWVFRPEQMHYVAVSNLKMNHQLRREDFTFPADLAKALYDYLSNPDELIGGYLKSDVNAGQPIRSEDVARQTVVKPAAENYVIGVRLAFPAGPTVAFEPQSKVILLANGAAEKAEGIVVSSSLERTPTPAPTPAIRLPQDNKPSATPSSSPATELRPPS